MAPSLPGRLQSAEEHFQILIERFPGAWRQMTERVTKVQRGIRVPGVRGVKISLSLSILCVALFGISLLFRAILYPKIPLAPGDPYGMADIIEFALGSILLGLLGVSLVAASFLAVKGPRSNRVAAAGLTATAVMIALVAPPMHRLAACWAAPRHTPCVPITSVDDQPPLDQNPFRSNP